ncbi:ATP-grasp domain-containing protein [Rivibacter subsaxonicus]|uniref:Putative ATP-grasp superfamily ATP-dependent carboligase n=1 Tax=Rivibacter subsaxonicus TaxID=457575 RepID=A0A4Q7W0S4_9BURK|nr:ATP-grasp domain-containing protein [Rivibacter subsaxonicus]RZU02710.1 putative ATP-grasp superfamily ATP-dependent carboligase [Rivibacter subsaxonicus]
MKNVLVVEYLSAGGLLDGAPADGTLLAQGLAMRDALAADLAAVEGVAVSVAAEPGAALESWLAEVQHRFEALWVVAPECEGRLAALHAATAPARWIGCDAEAIATAGSKRATLGVLDRARIPTPLAFEAEARAWVVKPDDGAGAGDTRCHTRRVDAETDLRRRQRAGAAAVLEPWVEGETLSLTLLCRAGGRTQVLARNRQRIGVDVDGSVSYAGVELAAIGADDLWAPALDAVALRAAAALPGLRGVVGIDMVWHPQCGPVVIEINPRLTCAYVGLSAAAGFNVAAAVLADHFEAWGRASPVASPVHELSYANA